MVQPREDIEVEVQAQINPTEDPEKVIKALENVFGPLQFKKQTSEVVYAVSKSIENLERFGSLLRRERIRAAARKVLYQGLQGTKITFFLNKQVAYAGHISFCEPVAESPLGSIEVQIRAEDPARLIDLLAPRTSRK